MHRLPGLLLCLAVSLVAVALQTFEVHLFGRAWLEALVIAIVLGTLLRTAWTPGPSWTPGIGFSGRFLLEVGVMLLGATITARTLLAGGFGLFLGIGAVVAAAIAVSYGVARLLGLPRRMATLIACGNSICGNSAIAAVAPVIGADGDDVATSIAFTAVLGVAVVLGLPALSVTLALSPRAFGVFAGLTVYAVPQVLAATAPISSYSAQVGTLVKLIRVLMLGPVVLVLSLLRRRRDATRRPGALGHVSIAHLLPWFIVGFLLLIAAHSAGLIPEVAAAAAGRIASALTLIAMAALGLGVDVRVVARAGPRVIAVVTLSLVALGCMALGLIRLLGID